jgi:NACHT domain
MRVCTHLPTTYRLSIAYLAKLPCAVKAGYCSGNHKPCLQGTREGVLWDIEAWEADEMNESVYWLKGVAGCGKSTIAQTFAERSAAKGNLGASFFCSRDYPDRRNLHLIFLTLARDLAYWSADFKTALMPIIRVNPNVQDDTLPVQLEKLLVRPFKQTDLSATIIVDALDECEDKEPVSEFLSALAVHVGNMPTVRFFITGRPEDRIRSGFKLPSLRTKELPLHDVDSATVDSDIKAFVTFRLDEIATRRRQSISGQWPSDRDIAVILKKTSGLFIIASVILRFIDSPFASPQKRLKLIVDPQESTIYEGRSGIDVVYHQILSASFEDADENDPVFFQSAASRGWVYRARPQTVTTCKSWRDTRNDTRRHMDHPYAFTFSSHRAGIRIGTNTDPSQIVCRFHH